MLNKRNIVSLAIIGNKEEIIRCRVIDTEGFGYDLSLEEFTAIINE